jgi:hypothetical protein
MVKLKQACKTGFNLMRNSSKLALSLAMAWVCCGLCYSKDAAPIAGKQDTPRAAVAKTAISLIAPGILEFDSIILDTNKREIRFGAEVNQTSMLIEYAIVHKDGKTHESLLRTSISPFRLQTLLLIANASKFMERLPEFDVEGREQPPSTPRPKHRIQIFLRDLRPDAKDPKPFPLENWIRNADTGKAMEGEPWMYTGSRIYEGEYVAELEGDIIAVYLTPNAMLNSWVPGNNNDELWIPAEGIPPVSTPVEVILKLPSLP